MMEGVVQDFLIHANIERYRSLLATVQDAAQRDTILALLEDELIKLTSGGRSVTAHIEHRRADDA